MSLRSQQSKLSLVRRRKRPDRVQPLATLPVFYKLEGRAVLLAGGSDAAAWKAELLAATGAKVHVYAEELDDEFDDIINASPSSFATRSARSAGARGPASRLTSSSAID